MKTPSVHHRRQGCLSTEPLPTRPGPRKRAWVRERERETPAKPGCLSSTVGSHSVVQCGSGSHCSKHSLPLYTWLRYDTKRTSVGLRFLCVCTHHQPPCVFLCACVSGPRCPVSLPLHSGRFCCFPSLSFLVCSLLVTEPSAPLDPRLTTTATGQNCLEILAEYLIST